MVAGRIPFQRRLRAYTRKIVAFLFWLGAACTSAVLYSLEPHADILATAQVELYPVRAGTNGRIAEIKVTEGQQVVAGETLAILEVPGLSEQIKAAEAQVDALVGNLAVEGGERDRRDARDLDGARARWLAATVALRDQEAALVELKVQYDRMTQPGLDLPALEVESLRVRRDALELAIAARRAEVEALEGDMQRSQARARGMLDPATQSQLDALRATVDALKAQQAATVLVAPHDGVVGRAVGQRSDDPLTERSALPGPGTWVTAGELVLTITPVSTREAVLWVDSLVARRLKAGQPLTLQSLGGTAAAEVQRIGPAVVAVPPQGRADPLVDEWKVPVVVRTVEAALIPGEPLSADF
ncbi:MAG TPA: biotin/lipoyl-binding protein [Myxococcota bacterium]|nr:biotin/lipoyl-binding protein [Myxococcota bacterium]